MFLPLLFFVILNGLTVYVSKKKFGICLPITFMISTFILYISQLVFGTFKPGIYVYYFMIPVSVVILVLKLRDYEYRMQYLSLGLFVTLFIGILFWGVDFRRSFVATDEFAHWGYMVKEMLSIDRFYCVNESTLLFHKEYPPFIPIFELLWCKLTGGYSEAAVTYGLHLFELSFVIPIIVEQFEKCIGKIVNKVIFSAVFSVSLCLLITTFDGYNIFSTILLDIAIPLMYAYGIFLIIEEHLFDSRFCFVSLVVLSTALMLSKQISIAYVTLLFLFCVIIILGTKEVSTSERFKDFFHIFILAIIAGCGYYSWNYQIKKIGLVGQFDFDRISVNALLGILSGNGEEIQVATFKKYIIALFNVDQTSGLVKLSFFSACLVALLLLFCIGWKFSKCISKNRLYGLKVLFVTGPLGYSFTMMILYLFCFQYWEMAGLASFERYMSSYLLSEYIIIAFLVTKAVVMYIRENHKEFEEIFALRCAYITILVMLVGYDNTKLDAFIPQVLKGNEYQYVENLANRIKETIGDDSTICVLSDDNITKNIALFNYYVDGWNWDMRYRELDIEPFRYAKEEAKTHIRKNLLDDDYLYVNAATDEINELLSEYNGGEPLSNMALYRINVVEGKMSLISITY